jgi:hypothetical protein
MRDKQKMIRLKVKFSLDHCLCCYSDGNNRNKIILAILTVPLTDI